VRENHRQDAGTRRAHIALRVYVMLTVDIKTNHLRNGTMA